jgi:hypothetical protein
LRLKLHVGQREHSKALAKIMRTMDLPNAFKALRDSSLAGPDVLKFVRSALASGKHSVGKKGSSTHLRAGGPPSGYAGVDKAKNMLNEMIEEVQTKYDLELQKCCDFDDTQTHMMEEARQDISLFNAEAAEARKEVLDAEQQIQTCVVKLPELADALQLHNKQCAAEIADLRAQLKIVNADIDVMSTILSMTECSKKKKLLLQQCVDECTGESFLSFKHGPLRKAVGLLKSAHVKELLDDSLADSLGQPTRDFFLNTTTTTTLGFRTVKRSSPCKDPVPADKRTGKCSISDSPNCPKLQEKFMYIQAGIIDKRDELMEQIQKLTLDCKTVRESIESQIQFFEALLKDQQTMLAGATKKQNTAEEQSRLKNKELQQLQKDYDEMTTTCHTNYATMEGEECGLKKIRGELYKMQGQDNPAFFQDCVVSEWLPGECSASCAGGVVTLTRSIMTHPVGGAKCPLLVAQKPCNEQKCPIDCKLNDWEGWSACSARCGGGLRERERYVKVEPEHGGDPCGETSDAQSCNVQSCDKDCELADWTPWSACSKGCNGGMNDRMKAIVAPAIGDGECPRMWSETRMQEKACNEAPCIKKDGELTLQCESRLDVILVIDGSAGLGEEGFEAMKDASHNIAQAFDGEHADVKLAVILFGETVEMVQHFSTDIKETAKKIEEMEWPGTDPYLAQALDAAKTELSLGRRDASSVVIVITIGKPMSQRKTRQAAKSLREQARLMLVPVTEFRALNKLRKMVSRPASENLLPVKGYADVKNPEIVDQIIADICPELS